MVEPVVSHEWLRSLVIEHCGRDPGDVGPETRLVEVGLTGVDMLRLVVAIEDHFAIEFPADLLTVIETVGELVHFTEVKATQAGDGGPTA